jgi:flagellar hook protein FlgE
MTIHHALYSAISGLQANSHGMSVISNNIANAQTNGFKADRAEFRDLLSVSLNEKSEVGRGVMLRNIRTLFNQGALSHTGQTLDLSIHGNGFFAVKVSKQGTDDPTGLAYTRDGTFQFDHQGYITDAEGNRVQGYMANESERLSSVLGDLRISAKQIAPKATSLVNLAVNLDSRGKPMAGDFSLDDPQGTSNYSTSVAIYDSLGQAHNVNLFFRRNENDPQVWNWYATLPSEDVEGAPQEIGSDGSLKPSLVAQGDIKFDDRGRPELKYTSDRGEPIYYDQINKSDVFEVQLTNGSGKQQFQINFGPEIDPQTKEMSHFTATNMAADYGVIYHDQDGHESGSLKTIKIENNGRIYGNYSNGKSITLGSFALANFNNDAGLEKLGGNRFGYMPEAGNVTVGIPETMNFGSVYSSTLEASNVDLTGEFVDMITTQRAFQANSRAVRTSDSLLEEILSLKY